MTKRTNTTSDMILKTFLAAGVDGVRSLTKDHKDPRKLIAKALEDLHMIPGFDATPLSVHLGELNAMKQTGGARGKKPVTVGDSRSYKAQLNKKTGQLFLIVPLPQDVIPVTKGDSVEAQFKNGTIVLS